MIYRRLGSSGLKLSLFSFGSWITFKNQVSPKSAKDLLSFAYQNGVNFFDNAEVYANGDSERLMGKTIAQLKWSRDTYCVSSKVFWGGKTPTQNGLSRKHIFDACHGALKRFQLDYLDLYFCHRPDPETPVEETVQAMSDLVRSGKVMYWGTSEWPADRLSAAYEFAHQNNLIPPTMEQPQYNLFHRKKIEQEFKPLFEKHGLGTTVWSPLASGLLTGKYNKGIPKNSRATFESMAWLKSMLSTPEGKQKIQKIEKLTLLAKSLKVSVSQLSLAWCAKNPNVSTVILGASKLEQLKENLGALAALEKLDASVMQKIESIIS